jgi:hypothetical protein
MTNAKIYLADQRGKHELDWFRSFHVFNFGTYRDEHRRPESDLYVFNDDTLAGDRRFELAVEEAAQVIIIPVTGTIDCNNELVTAGEALFINAQPGDLLHFLNPYEREDGLVNFIQLWFHQASNPPFSSVLVPFSLEEHLGKLLVIAEQPGMPLLRIGKYMGRGSGICERKAGDGFFVSVIEGVFEVEDRLLHARDCLELWDIPSIEYEALSNGAILLVVEISRQKKQ